MILPKWPNPNNFHHIELGLERIIALLNRLDNPHLKLPPTVHIAGTNGKGSTLAFLKSIYEEAGYKVHRYTSPHLVEFNERIEICGQKISDDLLQKYSEICQKACEISPKIDITFFEGTTAIAFLAFANHDADILLLETGMGGEFDATNVLPKVFQSIITPISFDHQEFLGNKLSDIAKAKAGIIKKNCQIICNNSSSEILEVIKNKSKKENANLIMVDKYFSKNSFDFLKIKNPLYGSHQIQNMQTAICSIKNQRDFKISNQNIIEGIAKTRWNARLQEIKSGKLFNQIKNNSKLFVDGSHNIDGAKTISEFLENQLDFNKIMVLQMMKDKDCDSFIEIIADKIDKIFIIKNFSNQRFFEAEDLVKKCQKFQLKTAIIDDFYELFSQINLEFSQEKNLILITGSLYQAGIFLDLNHDHKIQYSKF